MKADFIPVLGQRSHPDHARFQKICAHICPISALERRKAIAEWFQKFTAAVNEERCRPFRIAALENIKEKRESLTPL